MKIYNPTGFSTNLTGSFSGSVKGTLTATGNIIPDVSGAYDIGSTQFPFKDLYITQNSLKFIDDSTGIEIGRISVNSNTGDIKLLNTKNLTEEQRDNLTAENVGPEALSPVSASALWVSQSIFAGHANTDIGHTYAPFHTLHTQFISGSSATLTGTVTAGTFKGIFDGAVSSSIQLASDISGSFTSVSASIASDLVSNYLNNTTDTLDGDLTVTGKITAQEFHTEFVSASIIFQSGSTKFGDSADDVHEFTGSLNLSGSLQATSLIKIGGTSTQFLKADGSIDSTGYLPLSGGNITGNLSVDTNVLFVDTVNDRVGVGTSSPEAILNVRGSNSPHGSTGIPSIPTLQLLRNTDDSGNYAGLVIKTQAAGSDFGLYSNQSGALFYHGGTERMRITSAGKVGIGTSSPNLPLEIVGANYTIFSPNVTTISIRGTDSATSGNSGAGIDFSGYRTGTTQTANLAFISGIKENTTDNNYAGALVFGTRTNASGAGSFERMRITSAGNVGIGTSSPVFPLHVNGLSLFNNIITIGALDGTFLRSYAATNTDLRWGFTNNSSGVFSIQQQGDNYVNQGDRLVIDRSGNVGINTTAPKGKLHVKQGAIVTDDGYQNHQLAIFNSSTAGTLGGQLTVTLPETDGGANGVGYGGYSCEIYISGYAGDYCHAWFSGYVNISITPGETAILRSNGGWSVSQYLTPGTFQGITFVVDYPTIIHPTARIIFNKGGDPNNGGYNFNNVTITWS